MVARGQVCISAVGSGHCIDGSTLTSVVVGIGVARVARRKRKRKSRPTTKRRNDRQKLREAYSTIREDAQLAGIIPTEPEGAIRDERVDPTSQDPIPMPGLIKKAILEGWSTPEEMKPRLVQELIDITNNPDMPAKVRIAAFNALRLADEEQYKRNNPVEAGMRKGGGTHVNIVSIEANQSAADVIRNMVKSGRIGSLGALPAPATPPEYSEQTPNEGASGV